MAYIPTSSTNVLFTQSLSKTVSTDGVAAAVETTLLSGGTGTLTLPANFLTVGKLLRLTIKGLYSTPAISVGNILVKVKLGSTVLASNTANSLLSLANNLFFDSEVYVACRSIGPTGSLMINGSIDYAAATSNSAYLSVPLNNGLSTIALDTTIPQTLDITVLYSNNTNGNSITSTHFMLETLN